ncbi:MAG: M1 family metallopeptidase [Patescibacteria group bacterium]|nr:M1 family metallopeptidase [Patescibacteria group bacterium]
MTKSVTRLYEYFQPEQYGLAFNINKKDMTFSGRVTIRGKKVGKPSKRLTFHQKGLKITAASVIKQGKKGVEQYEIGRINNQDTYDEVRLHSEAPFYPGEYIVSMDFTGAITRPMNGIYPCFFEEDGTEKQLIATQFESHHAREAFPCIDEPEAKATFDLTVISPAGETVIANTPVIEHSEKADLQVNTFETTPRMSTYLLAFVAGDMGFEQATTKNGTLVRSYATTAKAPLTAYSVEVAVKVLEFFEDYFGVAYPLPKLDMVALPDFSSGAMENWGLVTYRESVMLLDQQSTSIETRQQIALVIAHELSHQWFGNLVTMKWWDDLWLNESFANMMEYKAIDAIYPEWNVWEQFVSHEGVSAKRRDSLLDVQSVHIDVNHPDEISTIFDPSIVYAKGGTLLHMLMHYLGEEIFRKGLQAYFQKHEYGNTTADDLWEALGEVSGQDVGAFMHDWLNRPGYPIVTVDWKPGSETVEFEQKRFLSDPNASTGDDRPWQVPLASTVKLSSDLLTSANQKHYLDIGELANQPLLLNHEGMSYFVPRYVNADHSEQISQAISDSKVSTIDRFLLLDNYNLLQRGGQATTTDMLDLMKAYKNETNDNVWGALAMSIAEARRLIEADESAEENLNVMIRELVAPLLPALGWDDKPNDDAQTLHLRGMIYSLAAGAKEQSVIDEGLKRFAAFKNPSDLAASTRSIVYFVGARYGTNEDFQKLLLLYKTCQSADEKDEVASGLTSAKAPERYAALIALLKTDLIRRQDLMHWFAWLLRNRYSRVEAWQWLRDNWEWVMQEFSSDKSFGYFARFCGGVFSKQSELDEFMAFFTPKQNIIALARDITLAEQEIKSRLAWRERNEKPIQDYFS